MSDQQVRIAFMGSFLGNDEASNYRDEFFDYFGQDVKDGNLILLEDNIRFINNHWVVRILAENSQTTMELELE